MMILSKLHLENFKKYTNFDIEFGEGLVGIIGKNGSGKSTIFEAILFALYGEFKNRGEKELVRNAHASSKDIVLVELEFEFDNLHYRVVREFRGKALSANAKLYKNEELTTSGAREVSGAIVALTKMGKDAFMHTLFASQKELTSLSTLKNEDRKRMIRRLLGLEKIDAIEKELIEKSRELKRTIAAFDEVLLSQEEVSAKEVQIKEIFLVQESAAKAAKQKSLELEVIKKTELDVKKELELFSKTKEAKQKALSELQLLKSTYDAEVITKVKLVEEIQKLEAKQKELEKLSSIKQEHKSLQEQLKLQESAKELYLKKEGLQKEQVQLREQYTKASDDIKTLSKECEGLAELLSKEQSLQKKILSLKQELKTLQESEKALHARLSAEKRVIEDTNAKIERIQNLGSSSACPTCTRPLLEEYDNVLNTLHGTIEEIQKGKIEKFTAQIATMQTELANLQTKILQEEQALQKLSNQLTLIKSKQNDLQKAQEYFVLVKQRGLSNKEELAKMDTLTYEPTTHIELQKSFESIKKSYEYVLSLEVKLQRHPKLLKELELLSVKLEQTQKSKKEKEESSRLIDYDEVKHQAKIKELDALQKTKDEQQNIIHQMGLESAKQEGEIKTIQASLEKNESELKKVQTKKEDLKDYDKIKISLVEFKTKLNANIAPRISHMASSMYSQITKGKYQHIEVSNDFDFFIYDEGKKYPIERFSGGEVDLANLVLRIAISKTLTELSGARSIGFLAFDEVFGSQDEARRMEILEAFHTIKEQYRQIFLISHEMEIKEMFERVVEL